MPHILELLLQDRTVSLLGEPHNILWANDNYTDFGAEYAPAAQMKPELITGERGEIIMPRALKNKSLQKERTKTKAEVFTPTWIVQKQNDAADAAYAGDDLETYTKRKWLEITCGEAPYMATRYEMGSGVLIPLPERQGFVDRKLARISREITDKSEWERLAVLAYKASYGFEWNGDSLLLARENLLYTFMDYYADKWREPPTYALLETVAEIISWNVFQMDGLTYTIPLSDHAEASTVQFSLFGEPMAAEPVRGIPVQVMNWETSEPEPFEEGVRWR
jgi:hypothetical protein